jgi:acylaminoacyl-peptidase
VHHFCIHLLVPFGGYDYNEDETLFVFVAEEYREEKKSFWNFSARNSDEDQKGNVGHQYDYEEHFGEQLSKVCSTSLFLLDLKAKSIAKFKIPDSLKSKLVAVSQVRFCPFSNDIVFIGYPEGEAAYERKLGLIYYNTRKSNLYFLSYDGSKSFSISSEDDYAVNCPRFSPNGKRLVYFATGKVWWHNSCQFMRLVEWDSYVNDSSSTFLNLKNRVLIEVERNQTLNESFQGLWGKLLSNPWLSDSLHVVFSTQSGCQEKVFIVDTDTGVVRSLKVNIPLDERLKEHYSSVSLSLWDVDSRRDSLLISVSTVNESPTVYYVKNAFEDSLEWICVVKGERLSTCSANVHVLRTKSVSGPLFEIEHILLLPEGKEKTRLVLFPHGGPHSSFTTQTSVPLSYLVSLGFSVLLVNFRGSTGYGQDMLESLPGHIGRYDVEDCLTALENVLREFPDRVCRSEVVVTGGSHGGFLVTSLIGRHPEMFLSAVARNPVTNIAHMYGSTDIPDWCVVESGISRSYSSSRVLEASDYALMYSLSPISFADRVTTPLLLLLGDNDRRVPMSQSLDYYKTLKSLGVTVRCLVYPMEQHGLCDRVSLEADVWVNTALWLAGAFR